MTVAENVADKKDVGLSDHYEPIRLKAKDAQALDVILCLLQDSLMPVVSITYDKAAKTLSCLTNRFCWEIPESSDADPLYYRVHAGLMFKNVSAVHEKNVDSTDRSRILSFLTAHIDVHDDRTYVYLLFSDDASIRIRLDQINCVLADIDEPWSTRARPEHLMPHNGKELSLS
ncbi:MAG: DUF2948 family protein [Alphaproteobacteria bacterium]|nr:DUF2948 family protein [Alphaproteobacteria bacterium]